MLWRPLWSLGKGEPWNLYQERCFWYYFCKMLDKLPSWDKLFLKSNKSSRDFLPPPHSQSAAPRTTTTHQERLVSRRQSSSVVSILRSDWWALVYKPVNTRTFKFYRIHSCSNQENVWMRCLVQDWTPSLPRNLELTCLWSALQFSEGRYSLKRSCWLLLFFLH